MSSLALVRTLTLLAAIPLAGSAAEPIGLKNGQLQEWIDGNPQDWTVKVSARSGGDALSQVTPIPGGGMELRGDAATGQWRSVSQRIGVRGQAALRLKFLSRTEGLKREGRQFNNCYIGLAAFAADGKRLSMQVRELFETNWAAGQLVVTAPAAAESVEVIVFLSKTGALQVKNVSLEQLSPSDSYDVLIDEFDRYYSFFALKGIDWKQLAKERESAGRDAQTADAFVAAVQPLLAELKDIHVSLEVPGGKSIATHISRANPGFDARTVAGRLKDVRQIGRMGFIGRTADGFGYLAIGSLAADAKTTDAMLAAFDSLLDAKGLIIDLRVNSGGSETVGQQFVSRLIAEPITYASNQFRGSSRYDDLMTLGSRQVAPHQGRRFDGPVVGLIGPGCVSSGEGMALMLRALPKAKLIGQNTRGASGNPQPVLLPNGVTVRYSTWVPLQLDGQPFEGVGIAPDLRIEDDPTGVKGLEAAIAELKAP